MENKHEHIPATIFDWIENKSFLSLESAEQQEVLQYISQAEYNELHEVVLAIRKSRQAGSTSRHAPVKKELLRQFDKMQKPGSSLFPYMHVLWKIAAVFFLFASGWLCHYLAGYQQNDSALVAEIDTVYVTQKTGDTIQNYDTIYLQEDPSKSKEKTRQKHEPTKMQEKRDATERVPGHIKLLPSETRDSSPALLPMDDPIDDSLARSGHS